MPGSGLSRRTGSGGVRDAHRNHGGDAPAARHDIRDHTLSRGAVDDLGEVRANVSRAEFLRFVCHARSVPQRSRVYTGVHKCSHRKVVMDRTLPAHQTCRHKGYRMTCEQYEALIAESENECMACGKPATKNGMGKLVIDHDYSYGQWAVRGLICTGCNNLFVRGETGPYWAQPYLTDPWFLRELSRLDLSPGPPPEPSRDSYLRDFDGHVWFYEEGAWRWAWKRSLRLTWQRLFYEHGPMNLTLVSRAEFESSRGYRSYVELRAWRLAVRQGTRESETDVSP